MVVGMTDIKDSDLVVKTKNGRLEIELHSFSSTRVVDSTVFVKSEYSMDEATLLVLIKEGDLRQPYFGYYRKTGNLWKKVGEEDIPELASSYAEGSLEHKAFEKACRKRVLDAINSATIRHRWNYAEMANNPTLFGTQNDWNQTLIAKINEVNKEFGGTDIICSSEISCILMDSYFFEPSNNLITTDEFNFMGLLGSLFLYVDIFLPASILIIVRKDFFTSEHPECAVIYVYGIPGL